MSVAAYVLCQLDCAYPVSWGLRLPCRLGQLGVFLLGAAVLFVVDLLAVFFVLSLLLSDST